MVVLKEFLQGKLDVALLTKFLVRCAFDLKIVESVTKEPSDGFFVDLLVAVPGGFSVGSVKPGSSSGSTARCVGSIFVLISSLRGLRKGSFAFLNRRIVAIRLGGAHDGMRAAGFLVAQLNV